MLGSYEGRKLGIREGLYDGRFDGFKLGFNDGSALGSNDGSIEDNMYIGLMAGLIGFIVKAFGTRDIGTNDGSIVG